MSGMRERAARALAAMAYAERFPTDPGMWDDYPDPTPGMRAAGERLRESYLSRSRPYADAVLAVAADVEGITGVLDAHRLAPVDEDPDWTCRCGETIAYAGLHLDLRALLIRHQAEALAAYILDLGVT